MLPAELINRTPAEWLDREQQIHGIVLEMRIAYIEIKHAENHQSIENGHIKFVNAVQQLKKLGLGRGMPSPETNA